MLEAVDLAARALERHGVVRLQGGDPLQLELLDLPLDRLGVDPDGVMVLVRVDAERRADRQYQVIGAILVSTGAVLLTRRHYRF